MFCIPDGDGWTLIASRGGGARNPAWYHNILSHPEVSLLFRGRRRAYEARVLDAEERAIKWRRAVETYEGYEKYQERTDRRIPVIALTPVFKTGA